MIYDASVIWVRTVVAVRSTPIHLNALSVSPADASPTSVRPFSHHERLACLRPSRIRLPGVLSTMPIALIHDRHDYHIDLGDVSTSSVLPTCILSLIDPLAPRRFRCRLNTHTRPARRVRLLHSPQLLVNAPLLLHVGQSVDLVCSIGRNSARWSLPASGEFCFASCPGSWGSVWSGVASICRRPPCAVVRIRIRYSNARPGIILPSSQLAGSCDLT